MNSILQYVLYLAILVLLAIPLGAYMKKGYGRRKNVFI